jgi:hypothetical protein
LWKNLGCQAATSSARKPLFAILKEKLRWKLRLQKLLLEIKKLNKIIVEKVLVEKPKLNFLISHPRFS